MDRRLFLSYLGMGAISLQVKVPKRKPVKEKSYKGFSVLQGYTDHNSVQFSVAFHKSQSPDFHVVDSNQNVYKPTKQNRIKRNFSDYCLVKLSFSNLTFGNNLKFQILEQSQTLLDEREFSLLDLHRNTGKLIFASCSNDQQSNQKIWRSLSAQKPDVLFMIGDAVYADFIEGGRLAADPEQLWNRFIDTRFKVELYKLQKLIPTLAIWDDHDYGLNGGDATYRYRNESIENFNLFFAQDEGAFLEKGPSVCSKLKAFGQNFYLLDGRSFRSKEGASPETHFGNTVESWMKSSLGTDSQPHWLIKGDQWFGPYSGAESFLISHPNDFKKFLSSLKDSAKKFIFVSGDVHFSEIMDLEEDILGYSTREITSSSIHSITFPGWHRAFKNPRRLLATSEHNFVSLNFINQGSHFDYKIQSFGKNNQQLFEHEFSL